MTLQCHGCPFPFTAVCSLLIWCQEAEGTNGSEGGQEEEIRRRRQPKTRFPFESHLLADFTHKIRPIVSLQKLMRTRKYSELIYFQSK